MNQSICQRGARKLNGKYKRNVGESIFSDPPINDGNKIFEFIALGNFLFRTVKLNGKGRD